MKDIARDLGVSVVTISKVIRNHGDISQDTRERVLRRMKELNYQPNLTARALVTGRTMSIGLIVPDLVHPFFAQVAKSLGAALRSQGYGLLIASSEEDPGLERDEINQMLLRRVDGLIVASAQTSPESFVELESRKTVFVLIDRRFEKLDANFIGVRDDLMGEVATEHLIEVGCKRIAHIRGPELSTGNGRFGGYARALQKHGLKQRRNYVVMVDSVDASADNSGFEAMQKLLNVTPVPDGVFCYNDPSAMGAMQAIAQAKVRVPEDIAVIGCGNTFYAGLLSVPLSSIDQGSADLGRQAAQLALSLIGSKTPGRPLSILLEPRLAARRSTLGHAAARD